jgi:hypothetical protein
MWHSIPLPDDVFGHAKQNLSDLRIYGLTKDNDTIEAPFILRSSASEEIEKSINFKLINSSKNNNGYFYTFEVIDEQIINEIELYLDNENFDYRLDLEGSNDHNKWFTLTEDYRIVSIKNSNTDYNFTRVVFPDSKYRYYRIQIKSDKKPELRTASINRTLHNIGDYKAIPQVNFTVSQSSDYRETIVAINLEKSRRISKVDLTAKDKIDFYRPISIKYLIDSIQTEKGWLKRYKNLYSGTLSSLDKSSFTFREVTTQALVVRIRNGDNEPLEFSNIQVSGFYYEIIARFNKAAEYFLVYGNQEARPPQYDIEKFQENIPTNLNSLEVGEEQSISTVSKKLNEPLFDNKYWLWGILVIIVLLLGGVGFKMLQK